MTRTISQIAIKDNNAQIFALCDDGTIWTLELDQPAKGDFAVQWTKLPPVPQT